jgi:hypothetical protein
MLPETDSKPPQPVAEAKSLVGVASMLTYLLYCIVWDIGIMAGCAYIVFWKGQSGWWFLLAMFIAGGGYKPDGWRKLWMPDSSPNKD